MFTAWHILISLLRFHSAVAQTPYVEPVYSCSVCDVAAFIDDTSVLTPNGASYRTQEFCLAASCVQDYSTCITQMGARMNCTGAIGGVEPSAVSVVCKCGPPGSNPIVTIPTKLTNTTLYNPTLLPPVVVPKGCSGSVSTPVCSSTVGIQYCPMYFGGSGGCEKLLCAGGDCSASDNRTDNGFNNYVCDNTVRNNGTYICNCNGLLDLTLAASITSPNGGFDPADIGNCTFTPFEDIVPVADALAGVKAANAQINLSPVLLDTGK